MDVHAYFLPNNYDWAVLAGIEETELASETKGVAVSKKGKLPGRKEVYRRINCYHRNFVPVASTVERCPSCGGEVERLLQSIIERGRLIAESPRPRAIRNPVLEQIDRVELNRGPPR